MNTTYKIATSVPFIMSYVGMLSYWGNKLFLPVNVVTIVIMAVSGLFTALPIILYVSNLLDDAEHKDKHMFDSVFERFNSGENKQGLDEC